jgi:hypothetical protein
MDDRLKEACERQFEHYVEMLFTSRGRAEKAFTACLREHPEPAGCYMRLHDLACRAERAVAWFARHGPCEFQPLPLFDDEQEKIICGGDLSRHLVVYYTNSLRQLEFDYLTHPLFFDYARGVMAHPDGPDHLLHMPEVLLDFPPKELPGLVDGFNWLPPDRMGTAAAARLMAKARRMRAEDGAMLAGIDAGLVALT